jgi:hypothetical protein
VKSINFCYLFIYLFIVTWAIFCRFRLLLACFCRHLPSAFETLFGSLGPEDLSWQNIRLLGRFSPGLYRLSHLVAVGGILIFGRLAAIFAGLEFIGLYYMHFEGKSPGCASLKSGCPMPIHRRGMGPAGYSKYPQKHSAHSATVSKPSLRQ